MNDKNFSLKNDAFSKELKPKPRKTKSLKLKYNPPRHSSSRPTPRGPTDTLETRSTSGSETSRFEDQNQDWSKDFPDSFPTGILQILSYMLF